ncbi:NUDIX hydrolase [Paeniglutamicibacter cryotolerans]|uniref:ADP-ribose pyrophosphatase YjhB (NUDIX family) n=1 Tax=Paeniglutamicibacter cryotolerans TaxID=670079 RepID=A0A839QCJ9_9MICC|nr:NUDIX domain-containing protein [Paeniglutamicibacter cryotolerans]MBB2993838.1 ADP-ribose pyrophosphatase YjhB (NUDIX family) [Paeniglutamicibacter cryotolerans]
MSISPAAAVPGFDTRLAAYCVVIHEDRILLALWDMRGSDPGFIPRWVLPGGGVELGESTRNAAVREVAEETGYRVELDELLDVQTAVIPAAKRYSGPDRPMQTVAVLYRAHTVSGELRHETGGSTSEAGWFSFEQVAALNRIPRVDAAIADYLAQREERK